MCALQTLGSSRNSKKKSIVYVGSYSQSIYAYRFDPGSAKLEAIGAVGELVNPSFLTTDRHYKFLYAVSEVEGNNNGAIAAFSIDRKKGSLQFLNSASSAGVAPCHLAVDRTTKMLMVANYGTGGVSVFPIEHEGRLGAMSALMEAKGSSVNRERQEGPHAHQVVLSADNKFAYVPDLGLDHIRIYRLNPSQAQLAPSDPPFVKEDPGSGPRHIAFHPNHKYAYVVNELKSVVTVFAHDPKTGSLKQIQTVPTVPPDFSGQNAPAEIEVDRAGKFVYASNRGHDSIAVFAIDDEAGTLKQVQIVPSEGNEPRGFQFDLTGHFLFVGNQKSNQFVIFRVDTDTGKLTPTDVRVTVPTTVAFQFVPSSESMPETKP